MDKEVLTLVNMLNDKNVHVYKDEYNNSGWNYYYI